MCAGLDAHGAETDRFGQILHRDYFIPLFEDMEELNKNSEQYPAAI